MSGRFKDSFSDLAETLRQIFRAPSVRDAALSVENPGHNPVDLLQATSVASTWEFQATAREGAIHMESFLREVTFIQAVPRREKSWENWLTESSALQLPLFQAVSHPGFRVPMLPNKTTVHRHVQEPFRLSTRWKSLAIHRPESQRLQAVFAPPNCLRDLELALSFPVAFPCRNAQMVPKALWMRYSLKLVKATGENIRNLELIGIFRIPRKGIENMRFDAKKGALFLSLSRDASGEDLAPFFLAKRRGDGELLSCFPEEG